MPYTIEDYQRDYAREHIDKFTLEEVLEVFPLEKLLKKLPPEERLKGIPVDERLKGIPVGERYDEIIDAIPNDLLMKLLKKKLSSRNGDEFKELLRQFGDIS